MAVGKWFVFEGIDGCGKSTLCREVANRIQQQFPDREVVTTFSPGGTPLGMHLRTLVKTPAAISADITMDPLSRQMLCMVDTINLLNTVIIPALNAGKIVISDRSSFVGTITYGLADGIPLESIAKIVGIQQPPRCERLFLLQLPVDVALQRSAGDDTRNAADHFDSKKIEFHRQVSQIYDSLLEKGGVQEPVHRFVPPERMVVLDAQQSPEQLVEQAMQTIVMLIE